MNYRNKHQINFEKGVYADRVRLAATTPRIEYSPIVFHLTQSDKIDTVNQLEFVNEAILGRPIVDPFWGEVFGSGLIVHQSEGLVEIGDKETKLPLTDFKGLLEEWLAFIS